MSDEFEYGAHAGEIAAAPSSPLAGLRAQRDAIKAKLFLDLRVPRYEIPVYVRFRPPEQSELNMISKLADKSKNPAAILDANAQVLANCCLGVFELDADGNPNGDPDEWPDFGPELADYLGKPELKRGADVAKTLYLTDGDLISTALRLAEWAGFATDRAAEEYEGNFGATAS